MALVEFVNPNKHQVTLQGPDKRVVTLTAGEVRQLPDYFRRYVPRYVKILRENPPVQQPKHMYNPSKIKINVRPQLGSSQLRFKPRVQPLRNNQPINRPVVGRTNLILAEATAYYQRLLGTITYPISNDIGIGILSYNRLHSLTRLIDSIRKYTNLNKTTIFISDESTDPVIKEYLSKIPDMVVISNNERLGVAGNTNRLMRCLQRFKYKIILNDDVEVLRNGWDQFYVTGIQKSNIHHFCMQQPGLLGAIDPEPHVINGVSIKTIPEKPHGAILAFDDMVFDKIGYFDEGFGLYGMEHVDWSTRVSKAFQLGGFHDIVGSQEYFKIHHEESSVQDKGALLSEARGIFRHKSLENRIRIEASPRTHVPHISCIVPYRGQDRIGSIQTVLQNLKAQRFPEIDIVMVEQNDSTTIDMPQPITQLLARSRTMGDPFTKAIAFNTGAAHTKYNKIIFHDADMLVQSNYINKMYNLLSKHDGVHIGKSVLYLNHDSTTRLVNTKQVETDYKIERNVGYFEGGTLGCTFDVYRKIGGFNEDFVGYGCEDCEFFDRLKRSCNFFNERTEDLIHLYHGRAPDWQRWHNKNKELDAKLSHIPLETRCADLRNKLNSKYQLDKQSRI